VIITGSEIVLQAPGVAQFFLFAVPGAGTGEEVKTFVWRSFSEQSGLPAVQK
jgi:hypothetical protein